MTKPLKEIKSEDHTVWMTQPGEIEEFIKKRETAFNIAKGKLADTNNIELVMQTAEAFGRGLFAEHIKDNPEEWTMQQWLENTAEQIFNPLGEGATFTKITEDEASSKVFRCLLHEDAGDPHMASLFNYGAIRGMFLSAFPSGEVVVESTMAEGAPMTEFIFKVNATDEDKRERERIKQLFTTIKKE